MPTTTRQPVTAPARPRSFDERLALAGLAMDERLAVAAVRFEVNTAHIEIPLPEITGPVVLPEPPCPYFTPVAQLLWRAHAKLKADGWCGGSMRSEDGRRCLLGAIQAEGGTGYGPESNLLYEVICRMDQGVASINRWNDAQRGPERPLLALERAARLASDRGL